MSDGKPNGKKHFSMVRSFALADFLTLGNAACGTAAIFFCLNYLDEKHAYFLWLAFALLPAALVLDFFDGYVARWRRKHSPLGADLDSLADIVSFGVAPAVIAYTLGMRGGWDVAILIYFVTCGIARLARFNVTAAAMADESGKVKYYEGTPIPTSLLLVFVLAGAFGGGSFGPDLWFGFYEIGPWTFHPLTLMFALSGSAMISERLRVPKP
ncbi:MAG: CDP-diacylglycerol--serine O-phosphatidyltransferase [Bradymonadaceae bacterium]|nr:CDP-diacylglycerol--serine O-phosphatidyltransferase [Lujinxingiaceae bacterium]